MSLAIRLLVALGLLAVFVTALVGFSARDVSRRHVERGFEQRIEAATAGLHEELVWEAGALGRLLSPLCRHDSFVDRTLVELARAKGAVERMSAGRRMAIREIVVEQRKALRLDELLLITGDGQVLGASDLKTIGTQRPDLAALLGQEPGRARLAESDGRAVLESHCSRGRGATTVGLVAARKIAPILERVGSAYGVRLALADQGESPDDPALLHRKLTIREVPGLEVTATMSREPLYEALGRIDRSIFLTGAIAVLLSFALAVFVAAGLSRPIGELARQTREVVRGDPKPVRARGGRELAELARSFNRTIAELTTMRKRLAKTERIAARREIARQVAHEIKNPLAPIRAAVETLRRLRQREGPAFDEYFDEASTTVLNEVHRIQEIVTQFTKFARMPPPQFGRIDLTEAARHVVGLHDARVQTKGPRVELHAAASLPEILADRDQLVQVLTNLVQNGIEAVEEGDAEAPVQAEIDVSLRRDSDHTVRIGVADNGPGVPADMQDRVFEPYVSSKPAGTGLGLAIVQRIVYEHGGEISYHPRPEGGALFEVVLPIDGPPLLDESPASA